MSFGVENGVCFGLAGINGAGKSTIFKILTNRYLPSSGSVYLKGSDLTANPNLISTHTAYCPQDDALFEDMTVDQHLDFYARVRGLDIQARSELKAELLAKLQLSVHQTKQAKQLSGPLTLCCCFFFGGGGGVL